jgi:DNA-binding CsgD family transcriptional regulator
LGTQRKLLDVVVAAYAPAADVRNWALNVSVALSELMPGPIPAFAFVQRIGGGSTAADAVYAAHEAEPLSRILATMSARATAEDVRAIWRGQSGVGTLSANFGAVLPPWFTETEPMHRSADALGLFFERADGCMITFNRALDQRRTLSPRLRANLVRVLTHLSLSERLLHDKRGAHAVLSTDGKVLHAEGDATSPGARSALRAQALRMDRARQRAPSDEESLGLWRGMVAGRWSLVDEFDSDGKRLFVARENVGLLAGSHALTTREQQVLSLLLTGRTNKLIAYELGLTASTVSLAVRSILGKTGSGSRAGLAGFAEMLRVPHDHQ